jgi:alkaline phosphatase D
VPVWDDHEIAGNAWRDGAAGHDDGRDGPWTDRVDAAVQAYHEWLPVRLPDPDQQRRSWRSLRAGDHAELICIDTRLWGRDRQPVTAAEVSDPARTILGVDQLAWLEERLRADGAPRWRVVVNQVMFHDLVLPVPVDALAERAEAAGMLVVDGEARNADQWDGYPAERERVAVAIGGGGGAVVLTGDVHSSWAWEGPANDGGEPAMVELVAPAVSSVPFAELLPVDESLVRAALGAGAGALSHVELSSHGYLLVDLGRDGLQAEWWYVDRDGGEPRFGAGRSAPRLTPMRLEEVADPLPDPAPTTAPPEPIPPAGPAPGSGTDRDDEGDGGGDGVPLASVGGAAVLAAVVGALVAIRRRRSR